MSARGFTLIELLLATALLLAVTGATMTLSISARAAVTRSMAVDEMAAGARTAMEMIAADARQAGASTAVAALDLGSVLPVLTATADVDTDAPGAPSRAIRLRLVPHHAPQGVLLAPLDAGHTSLMLDLSSRCPALGDACGFTAGMAVVISDSTRAEVVSVRYASPSGLIAIAPPVAASFAAGTAVAMVDTIRYGIRPDIDGSFELVRISPGGAVQPMLRHVVEFQVETPTPASATIVLRVEAASPTLRGPVGPLFHRAGTARRAIDWLPDLELRTSIAARSVRP